LSSWGATAWPIRSDVVVADCATARNNPVASLMTVSQYASARSRDVAEQQTHVFVRYMPVWAAKV
jgi:hypothetical protein